MTPEVGAVGLVEVKQVVLVEVAVAPSRPAAGFDLELSC